MSTSPLSGRRLLVLTPFPPSMEAAHGGARVLAQAIGRLASQHDVALATLRGEDDAPLDAEVRRRCATVVEIDRPGGALGLLRRWRRLALLAFALPRGTPAWVVDWRVQEFAHVAHELAVSWKPEIIQIEFAVMGQYVVDLPATTPRLLVEHDPGSRLAEQRLHETRRLRRLLPAAEVRSWRRYERRVLAEVDAAITFTERDRARLARIAPALHVRHVPIAAELPDKPLDPGGVEPESLLFVGSFDHRPNVDAAMRLAFEILPRVRARRPDTRLVLVGADPPPALRTAGDHVEVTGRVDEVDSYLDRAAVVTVPIRHGGGMRVKVLEALAAGKAIVSTRVGVAGLDVADGRQVVLAETDDEFAAAVLRLLEGRAARIALARRARKWAEEQLSWDPFLDAFEELYAELLRGRA